MKKNNTTSLLSGFIIRLLLCTSICILSLSSICSYIMLKLDLDLSYSKTFSIICVFISSMAISYFSTKKFKNNIVLMSIISNVPLIIFCLFNTIFNHNSFVILIIKIAIIMMISLFNGYIRSVKSKRIKV